MAQETVPLLSYRPPKGSGPPLLLLHGWGATFAVWQDLETLLAPHFQLVMVELPGFGRSLPVSITQPYYETCAEELERVRQALGIEAWAILGYSIGAYAAEVYWHRYAQHVTRIVMLCPARLRTSLLSGLRFAMALEHHWPRFMYWLLSNPRWHFMVRCGLGVGSGFGKRNRRAVRILLREMKQQTPEALQQPLRALVGWEVAPRPAGDVPALYLWGRKDPLIPRPPHPRPYDISLPSNHNAPLLVAPEIASYVIPYLSDGTVAPAPGSERTKSLG